MKPIITLALLLAFICSAESRCFHTLVSAGQSNSQDIGRGTANDTLARPDIDSRIKHLGRYGDDDMRVLPLRVEVVNGTTRDGMQDWINSNGHAFIVSVARRYVVRSLPDDCDVLIIPAGRSGTSILEWNGKIVIKPEAPYLFSDMVRRVRSIMNRYPDSILAEFHWSQGEADAKYAVQNLYGMRPAVFRDELREFFDRIKDALPGNYPIIGQGFLPSWDPGDMTIKAEIENVIRNVAGQYGRYASTTGLTGNDDASNDPHFNAASMTILGARRANAAEAARRSQR